MATYTRRAQVLLTDEQFQSLQRLSEEEDKPMGALLREAAEEVYFREEERRRMSGAARALLSLPPSEVPEDYQEWERQYLDERWKGHA